MVIFLTACTSSESAQPDVMPTSYENKVNPLSTDVAESGARLFRNNCETCHGAQGHGDGPAASALDPAPMNLAELQFNQPDSYLYWRVAEGKPGTSMPPWKNTLTEEQIWQIITFVRTLK